MNGPFTEGSKQENLRKYIHKLGAMESCYLGLEGQKVETTYMEPGWKLEP